MTFGIKFSNKSEVSDGDNPALIKLVREAVREELKLTEEKLKLTEDRLKSEIREVQDKVSFLETKVAFFSETSRGMKIPEKVSRRPSGNSLHETRSTWRRELPYRR